MDNRTYNLVADACSYAEWWVGESMFEAMDDDERQENLTLYNLCPPEVLKTLQDIAENLNDWLRLVDEAAA